MRRALLGLLALHWLLGCDSGGPGDRTPESPARAQAPLATQAPKLWLLATRPGASESELLVTLPGSTDPPTLRARFAHAPDAEVRGALVGASELVVVVADMERRRDPSFGAWLLALEPDAEPRVLAKGCSHASRPLVLETGRVLVQRGSAGPELEGQQRVDDLSIDEVDPVTGSTRRVLDAQGFITHLAGALGGEAFVYRVRPGVADLVAVDVESGATRVLADSIPAQARDFSVDPSSRSLVYTNHDSAGWHVERLDLATGAKSELTRALGMWITPSVWPGGGVLMNDGRGGIVLGGSGPSRPLGPGFDEVRATSGDFVALLHRQPSSFSQPFVTDRSGKHLLRVRAPSGARLEIAGLGP